MSILRKSVVAVCISVVGVGASLAADPIDARKLFADNCSGCHQAGRVGTRFAPALVKERLGALSNNAVSAMIMTGIPGTIMPPWVHKLSDVEIGALATLVRTSSADKLEWSIEDAKKTLTVLVDEKSLPAAPAYKADVLDLMAVMQRGRHAQAPESRVVFFDGKTNERVGEVPTTRAPHILRYHPTNPRWAYVKTDVSEIYKIDLYSMQAVRRIKTGLSGPLMAVSWDGKWIAASSNVPGAFFILDADTLEPVKHIKLEGIDPSGKQAITFTGSVTAVAGGQFTVAARTLGEVWIIDPNKPDMPITKVSTKDPGETTAWLYDGFTSEDLRYLYITDRSPNDKIKIVDVIEKKYVGSLPTGCNPHVGSGAMLKTSDEDLYFSPNGNHGCNKGPVLTVWDGKTGKLFKQIKVDGAGSVSVAINPNAPYIVVDTRQQGGGYLNLIDKNTLEVVKKADVGGATGYPEYTRDGRFLYVGAGYWGDHLRIYDSKTFELVKEYRMPAPAGTFAHARVLWGGLKGAQERPLGSFADSSK
jgi:nitrite reductase (NO-forming)/hydroxylamine reductase